MRLFPPLLSFCKGRGNESRLGDSRCHATWLDSSLPAALCQNAPCVGIASNVMNSILSFLPQLFFFFFLRLQSFLLFCGARVTVGWRWSLRVPVVLLNNLTGVKLHIYFFSFFRISLDLVFLFCFLLFLYNVIQSSVDHSKFPFSLLLFTRYQVSLWTTINKIKNYRY